MEVAIPFFVVAVVFGLWGAISPRGMWQATQSWRYKNPEANEPSEAQNTMTRVGSIIAIGAVVLMIPLLAAADEEGEKQQEQQNYESCLIENQDSDGLLSAEDWCEDLAPEGTTTDSDDDDSEYDDYDEYDDDYDSDLDYG